MQQKERATSCCPPNLTHTSFWGIFCVPQSLCGTSTPQKLTQSWISHPLDIWMQHNCSHQRRQPFYQSQPTSPFACWDREHTALSDKVPLISLSIFHFDSYCTRLAPGSKQSQGMEMLEGRGGEREREKYMWVAHECQHQAFTKKQGWSIVGATVAAAEMPEANKWNKYINMVSYWKASIRRVCVCVCVCK